jgi:N-acetylglucosamine transport system substrate-binding protein
MTESTARAVSRRRFLRVAGLGLATVPVAGALSACASSGRDGQSDASAAPTATDAADVANVDPENPFGVDPTAELRIIAFDGGYGREHADYYAELYSTSFPDANVDLSAIQELSQNLQPRFVAGDPPDVINNAGSEALDTATLVSEGQLASLQPLLDAPSIDDPSVTVAETLTPGVVEAGSFGDGVYALNYVNTVYGIWYSHALLEQHGWDYPATWDEMIALCHEAKAQGIYGWTYGGTNAADYFREPMMQMAAKNGGLEVLRRIDNLEPDAWRQDSVVAAVEAIYRLHDEDLLLPGSEGLQHVEAQTEWVNGEALFYPSGSWLENEMASITPEGFDMVASPVPNLSSSDPLDFSAITVRPRDPYIVTANGANSAGGLEYLRIMLSHDGARKFSELTGSPTVVLGAFDDDADISPALASLNSLVENASETELSNTFATWYPDLRDEFTTQLGNLLAGRTDPDGFIDAVQKAADDVAADDSITKYTR